MPLKVDDLFRDIIQSSNYAVTPNDLEQLTLSQLSLYFAKPKLSEGQAVAIAKKQAARKKAGMSDAELEFWLRRMYA